MRKKMRHREMLGGGKRGMESKERNEIDGASKRREWRKTCEVGKERRKRERKRKRSV